MRWLAGQLVAALLAPGCATRSEPAVDAVRPSDDECLEVARRESGYRGLRARTNSQIEQRIAERWPDFVRAYEACMQARDHESDT